MGSYATAVRGTYTAGTCTFPGCANYTFTNANGQSKTFPISTCVTERTGTAAFTDAAPSASPLGRDYPSSGNPCLANTIVPLSSNATVLNADIDALNAGGSTGGQIGIAWAWYLLSPNFVFVWPSASQPATYGRTGLIKAAVIMTDGEYNSSYCNGVISLNSTPGSGSTSNHINCNAPNGHSYVQATHLCAGMKAAGVIVYTVGFDIVDDQRARDLMSQCATDAAHAYSALTGDELKSAFRDIAQKITALRISK